MAFVPIMRPKLPTADKILPYLKRVDDTRIYGNFGPLVTEFETRLAARYALPAASLTTLSNATVGLALALMALNAKPGTFCVMPAWTFIASVHAAVMAGLTPYFVDVEPKTWALDPMAIERLCDVPGELGAVMPVAPFGSPIDGRAWDAFTLRTGVPVVIDAAAGFDVLSPTRTPIAVSLHATKVLGIGEGAFVVSTDEAIIKAVRARSNFGFFGSRIAGVAATNGKLSEYQAAVGLAALDEWEEARSEWMAVAAAYARALSGANDLNFQDGFGETWVGSVCLLRASKTDGRAIQSALAAAGIETRRWWGDGAHRHPVATGFPRTELEATEQLVESTIAVPFYRDLSPVAIGRVVAAMRGALT